MSDVVNKLWGFCHTLRHDGVDYGDYIEQITYLLFLKMANEKDDVTLPAGVKLHLDPEAIIVAIQAVPSAESLGTETVAAEAPEAPKASEDAAE